MNISTYEARLKALANHNTSVDNAIDGLDERVEALEGGSGSGDGAFIITFDSQEMTSNKTFSEIKNAVLDNAFILVKIGDKNVIPDRVKYTGDDFDIYIDVTMFSVTTSPTPIGVINRGSFIIHPDDSLGMGTSKSYTFTITEVTE